MKKIYTFLIITFISMTSIAQENLTLQELIPGGENYTKYWRIMPSKISWWGDKLIQIKETAIIEIPRNSKEKENVLYTIDDFSPFFNKKGIEFKNLSLLGFPSDGSDILTYTSINNDTGTSIVYFFDINKKEFISEIKIPENSGNIVFTPNNKNIAYTISNNLYIQGLTYELISLMPDNKEISFGANNVHRNEFGIHEGIFWSPKQNFLAYYIMDESMVGNYPLVDISARKAELRNIKYPMAGMNSHKVKIGIQSIDNKKNFVLKANELNEEIYLTNIAWSPDEKHIYIAELNRGQDTCSLNKYNIETGEKEATLFTETHPKYVEPENPVLFLKNNPEQFIWQSERDGYNHLYLYKTSGKLIKQLTKGSWTVLSVLGFDESGNNILIVSTEDSPVEAHIYKVNLESGKRIKLSTEEGVHNAKLNHSGSYIIDYYSSQNNPGKVAVIDTKTNKFYIWFTAENPFKNIKLPQIEFGSIKANDKKTDLFYRLVKPTNFDPEKKYPVIVYVYGGPHSQMTDNSWLAKARGWDIYMAQKGYIVFTLDNRGSSNRGLDFENIIHRKLGIVETQDQMTGIEFLYSQPYVDKDRIGVHGWSYGGFLTLNLMLRHSDIFKVGVAGGPVTDWKYYEIMYAERYMDSPHENPEGYENTSMLNLAGNLKGRLMLIHGDEDPVVVMQNSLQFLKSAITKGTHPDFFIYPGHEHNMTGKDRVHLHEHITRYFDDFLK